MEYMEKARIRMEHWLRHNASHVEEYAAFSEDLKNHGFAESAEEIQKMAQLMKTAEDHLVKAIALLK